jgi:hypothetical protein
MVHVDTAGRRPRRHTLNYEEITREMTFPFLLARKKLAFRMPIIVEDGDALAALVMPSRTVRPATRRLPRLSRLVADDRRAERSARYRSLSRIFFLIGVLALFALAALRSGKLDPRSMQTKVRASRVWLAAAIAP